jgi:Tfp pilus assembly protein PilN
MIQINLLPDVKMQYLKVRRTQRLVISISTLLIVASLVIFVLLVGTVDVFQKKTLSDLNNNITTNEHQLQNTPNLNKILTVQNQLQVLSNMHNQKPAATRLFGFLQQVTPSSVTLSQFNIDYTQNTISVTGNADTLDTVNDYTDTLKFTTFKKSNGTTADAFTSVVLSQFSRSTSGTTYTITASFDPNIFNSANNVALTVPNIISTRSVLEQPTDLFSTGPTATNTSGQ